MNNTKHRVVLRERPLNSGSDEESVIEIETVEQLKNKISSSPNEMHLYLGSYNLGEMVACEGEYIGFVDPDDWVELDIATSIQLKEGQTVQLSHVIRKLNKNEDEFYNTYMNPKKTKGNK